MNPKIPKTHPNHNRDSLYCGNCEWYKSGFNGHNCQNVRKVEVDTPACIEFEEKIKTPYDDVLKDKYLQELSKNYNSDVLKIDESIIEELKSYIIKGDTIIKNDYASDNEIKALNDALSEVISYRERISVIFFGVDAAKNYYDKLEEMTDMWLYSKRKEFLNLKNELQRKSAKDYVLPNIRIEVGKNIKSTLKLVEYVNSKLDSCERTLNSKLSSALKTWGYNRNLMNLK